MKRDIATRCKTGFAGLETLGHTSFSAVQDHILGVNMRWYSLAISIVLATTNSVWAANGPVLGIYFDSDGLTNCLPEVVDYPFSTSAFLVLTGAASAGNQSGLVGWEARVSWDDSLLVSLAQLSGQALNLGSFPRFVVGLSEPLPVSDSVVLSRLNVLAAGTGGLYLSGAGASFPDSVPGVIFGGDSEPTAVDYAYGGPGLPSATIGRLNCPVVSLGAADSVVEIPPPGNAVGIVVNPAPGSSGARIAGRESGGVSANCGFVGTIVAARIRCVELPVDLDCLVGRVASAMELSIDVTQWFWGSERKRVDVFVLGYSLADCMVYLQDWGLPPQEQIVPGAECFVAARDLGQSIVVSSGQTFELLNGSQAQADLDSWREELLHYSERAQILDSDVVVDARLKSKGPRADQYLLVRKVKGEIPRSFEMNRDVPSYREAYPGRAGALVRLYLRRVDGAWHPLHGKFSVQRIGGQQ